MGDRFKAVDVMIDPQLTRRLPGHKAGVIVSHLSPAGALMTCVEHNSGLLISARSSTCETSQAQPFLAYL